MGPRKNPKRQALDTNSPREIFEPTRQDWKDYESTIIDLHKRNMKITEMPEHMLENYGFKAKSVKSFPQ